MDALRDMITRARARMVRLGRSPREFLAGFGTSGSLLAGAALMFIVASTMVAFRGWPHVGAQPSPGEVVVSPRPTAATSSAVARRLAVFAALPVGAAGAPAGAVVGGPVPARAPAGTAGGPRRSIGQPAATSRPIPVAAAAPTPSAAGGAPACCASRSSSGSGSAPLKPIQQAIGQATGALGGVVSGAGNQAGSAVQQTSGAVGSTVQPVSPPAAGAVNSAGSGAAKTVTGVTQTIAGALSGSAPH